MQPVDGEVKHYLEEFEIWHLIRKIMHSSKNNIHSKYVHLIH